MVQRGQKKARNKFYKLEQPLIASGAHAGRRDSPRITARVQVIPDGAFNMFGERKLTGFTLDEIKDVADGGAPKYITDDEDRQLAKLELGPGIDQWTKDELYEIVDTVRKEGGVFLTASRMDRFDLERERLSQGQQPIIVQAPAVEQAPQEKPKPRRGRPPKNVDVETVSGNGTATAGDADSEDATA